MEASLGLRRLRRAALAPLGEDPTRCPPVVEGYEVGAFLGAGGSSVVWSGTGPDGVARALKVLAPDGGDGLPGDPAGGADVLRELSMLRRVRHPRVVAVHDISRDERGRPVLVLDLAAGGSLAGLLAARTRLGAGEASGLLAVLGPALEELHAAGIVHGDVAPGNVLLDARGEPLLADLGLARALGHRHGSVLGTPGFADPAAIAGEGASAASDVYGLAAVAWCALTGSPPAPTGAVAARLAVRRAGAELPAGTSTQLLEALREALHRKPSRRPTPGELAQAATSCVRPRPVRPVVAGRSATRAPVPERVPTAVSCGSDPEHPTPVRAVTQRLDAASPPLPTGVRARPTPGSTDGARVRERGKPPRPRRRVLVGIAAAVLLTGCAAGAVLLHRTGTTPVAPVSSALVQMPPVPMPPVPMPPVPAPSVAAPSVPAAPVSSLPEAPPGTETAPTPHAASQPLRGVLGSSIDGVDVLRGEDFPAVVTELAARRAAALIAADPQALAGVDVDGSTALAADRDLLAQLGTSRFAGLAFEVGIVAVEQSGPARVVVRADVTTLAHEVLDDSGVATPVAVSAARTSRLTLVRLDGEWRISDVG
ncbi:MAG: protein kinase domain-containing protein [Janthinobacterium lividum]